MDWVECWSCGRDYSLKVTWRFRLGYVWRTATHKAHRIRQAYGGVVKFWLKEFYWLPREWEVKHGHHYWAGRDKPQSQQSVGVRGPTEGAVATTE